MKFKIVRVELRDEEVLIFMKRVDKVEIPQRMEIRSPEQIVELGLQMGINLARRIEDMFGFDAFVTLKYDEYITKELKVGDFVDIEIKEVN
ncbi:MAG: hypothetical protein RMH75_05165 [Archaeoglobaceae archaeon]|nr:hypothetical protein [Archaeoglobaceae archaeon]